MIVAGKITKRLKPTKILKGKVNHFLQ